MENLESLIDNVDRESLLLVKKVLEDDPNRVNTEKNEDGETALIRASYNGSKQIVEYLLQREADVNIRDNYGWNALACAVIGGHLEIVDLLLGHNRKIIDIQDNNGDNALIIASSKGNIGIVQQLLDSGASVNIKNNNGETAMSRAIEFGHIEVIQSLLKTSTLDLEVEGEESLLMKVVRLHDVEIIKILLGREKLNINYQNNVGWTALILAAVQGDKEIVDILLKSSADVAVDAEDCTGETALTRASYFGKLEVLKLLLEAKAEVNKSNNKGDTALILAAERGNIGALRVLLDFKAAINGTNQNGETALIRAAKSGQVSTLKFLLDNGANVEAKDKVYGWTALFYASMQGNLSMARTLLLVDPNSPNPTERCPKNFIDEQDMFGETALMKAVALGHSSIVALLLEYEAHLGIVNKDGHSALEIADAKFRAKVIPIELLEKLQFQKKKQIKVASRLLVPPETKKGPGHDKLALKALTLEQVVALFEHLKFTRCSKIIINGLIDGITLQCVESIEQLEGLGLPFEVSRREELLERLMALRRDGVPITWTLPVDSRSKSHASLGSNPDTPATHTAATPHSPNTPNARLTASHSTNSVAAKETTEDSHSTPLKQRSAMNESTSRLLYTDRKALKSPSAVTPGQDLHVAPPEREPLENLTMERILSLCQALKFPMQCQRAVEKDMLSGMRLNRLSFESIEDLAVFALPKEVSRSQQLAILEALRLIKAYGVPLSLLRGGGSQQVAYGSPAKPAAEVVMQTPAGKEPQSTTPLSPRSVDKKYKTGKTALIEAVIKDRVETVNLLLKSGAMVNIPEEPTGWTPLMHAADKGQSHLVQLLLGTSSVETNHQDMVGDTALMRATLSGHADVVKLLLAAGAAVGVRNKGGLSALDMIRSSATPHSDVIEEHLEAQQKKDEAELRNQRLALLNISQDLIQQDKHQHQSSGLSETERNKLEQQLDVMKRSLESPAKSSPSNQTVPLKSLTVDKVLALLTEQWPKCHETLYKMKVSGAVLASLSSMEQLKAIGLPLEGPEIAKFFRQIQDFRQHGVPLKRFSKTPRELRSSALKQLASPTAASTSASASPAAGYSISISNSNSKGNSSDLRRIGAVGTLQQTYFVLSPVIDPELGDSMSSNDLSYSLSSSAPTTPMRPGNEKPSHYSPKVAIATRLFS